jgi:hypothetical protein
MHLEEINELCRLLEALRRTPPFSDEVNLTRYADSLLAELRSRQVVTRIGSDKIEGLQKIPREVKEKELEKAR